MVMLLTNIENVKNVRNKCMCSIDLRKLGENEVIKTRA